MLMQNLNSQTPQSEKDRDSKAGDKAKALKAKADAEGDDLLSAHLEQPSTSEQWSSEMLEEKEAKDDEWMESGVW